MKIYNFGAGPSMLPEEVVIKAKQELEDGFEKGMTFMERSHRSSEYEAVHNNAIKLIRELMGVPDNYEVLLLQGGGSQQFAMTAMNLMTKNKKADYIVTGVWAKKALDEAKKIGDARGENTSEDTNFSKLPDMAHLKIRDDVDYVYMTTNNTIYGTSIHAEKIPTYIKAPLVADMSSNILSEPYNVKDFGLIFAGAQKNLGISGVTLVILNPEILGDTSGLPKIFDYKTHIEANSIYNTPPTYAIFILNLVLEHLKQTGSVSAAAKRNKAKADLLYGFLDESKLFKAVACKEDRSFMNVCFVTGDKALDEKCVNAAKEKGIIGIKGHRKVGGLRASIYNAMPIEGVKYLTDFLKEFEKGHVKNV